MPGPYRSPFAQRHFLHPDISIRVCHTHNVLRQRLAVVLPAVDDGIIVKRAIPDALGAGGIAIAGLALAIQYGGGCRLPGVSLVVTPSAVHCTLNS